MNLKIKFYSRAILSFWSVTKNILCVIRKIQTYMFLYFFNDNTVALLAVIFISICFYLLVLSPYFLRLISGTWLVFSTFHVSVSGVT